MGSSEGLAVVFEPDDEYWDSLYEKEKEKDPWIYMWSNTLASHMTNPYIYSEA